MSAVNLLRHLLQEHTLKIDELSDQENTSTNGLTSETGTKGAPRHYEERRLRKLAFAPTAESSPKKREVLRPLDRNTAAPLVQECVDRLIKYGGQKHKQRERLAKEYQLQEQTELRDTKPPPSFVGPIKSSTEACVTLYEEGKTKLKKREAYQEREFAAQKVTPQLCEGTRILLAKGLARPRPKKKLEPPEYSFQPAINPESARLLANRPRQALYPARLPAALPLSVLQLAPSPSAAPTCSSPHNPHRTQSPVHNPCTPPHSRRSMPNSSPGRSSPTSRTPPRVLHSPSFSQSPHATDLRVVSPRELLANLSARKSIPASAPSFSPSATLRTDGDESESHTGRCSLSTSSETRTSSKTLATALPLSAASLQHHIERQALARQRRAEAALPVHVTGANWKPKRKPTKLQGHCGTSTHHHSSADKTDELGVLLQELVLLNESR